MYRNFAYGRYNEQQSCLQSPQNRSFPIKERTITVTFRLFREQVLQGHDTYEITAVFIVSQPVCSD